MDVWSHFSLLLLTVALVVFTLLQREIAPHLKIPYLPASLIPKPPYYGAQIPRSSNLTNRLLLLLVGMAGTGVGECDKCCVLSFIYMVQYASFGNFYSNSRNFQNFDFALNFILMHQTSSYISINSHKTLEK